MASSVAYRWSGQIMEPADGLAFIGRNPMDDPNVFIATGDSGNGMTHGTIAGILITDLILGRDNEWAHLYDPARKSLRALPEYAKENIKSAAAYDGWATAGDVGSAEEIHAGEGAIVRRGPQKGRISRRLGETHEAVGDLSPPRLHCRVELGGEDLGLPVPRFTLRGGRTRGEWAREGRPSARRRFAQRLTRPADAGPGRRARPFARASQLAASPWPVSRRRCGSVLYRPRVRTARARERPSWRRRGSRRQGMPRDAAGRGLRMDSRARG